MYKFDFTKDEYEKIKEQIMLKDEYLEIFEMKIKGYSIVEMSMKLHLSTRTINRRIKEIRKRIERVI